MAVYRITRFAASDMNKVTELTEGMRATLAGIGADFIDLVSYGNGKGVVIARYPDQATMDAAADTARKAFADMIAAGTIDGDSVHPHTGDVINSF
jgi:20S proteasome alpha/beta subunit